MIGEFSNTEYWLLDVLYITPFNMESPKIRIRLIMMSFLVAHTHAVWEYFLILCYKLIAPSLMQQWYVLINREVCFPRVLW